MRLFGVGLVCCAAGNYFGLSIPAVVLCLDGYYLSVVRVISIF